MTKSHGGLEMLDLNVKCLGKKLHSLRSYWGSDTLDGKAFKEAYETFLMDVGLGGNVFERDYHEYNFLAERSWFKHLWRLCHNHSCRLVIDESFEVPKTRTNDRPIMDVFLESGRWNRVYMIILNRVRRYKKVHHVSEVFSVDGRHLDPRMLTDEEVRSS